MNIFVVNIMMTLIVGALLLGVHPTEHKKRIFIGLTTVSWILISGLRGLTVGDDTIVYRDRFLRTANTSWRSLFKNYYFVYVNDEGKDPGYSVFEKVVQIFTGNYQVYLVVIAVIFFTVMAWWIYKYSAEPCLSYLIFSSFLFAFYALTGLRQTLATVLVVFIGTKLIEERKFWRFLLVVAVAFTVHKSAICFLPFYFLSRLPVNKWTVSVVAIMTPVVFRFNEEVFRVLGFLVGYEYDELENRGAYGFTFMYLAVTVVMVIFLKHFRNICENYKMYYNALFLGLLFLPLVFVNPTAMRVVQYYSLFLMLSIPQLLKCFDKKLRSVVYVIIVTALLLATNVYQYTYYFFWQ